MKTIWQAGRFHIDLSTPRVMGIVNITPDSFSDGGQFVDSAAAVSHCEQLLQQGADILDLGAESTRPGAVEVSPAEEWQRLAPVLREAVRLNVPISVDTRRAEVMKRALDAGADIINDVQALSGPGCLEAVAAHAHCGVCLMHMQGQPATMQARPHYAVDIVAEVSAFLGRQLERALQAGLTRERLIIDPGIGFGKTPEHNLMLLRRQAELLALGLPLLVGWSRKSTLGLITGRTAKDRVSASVAAALISVQNGARVVRVHDVADTVDALKVLQAVSGEEPGFKR